VLTGQVPSYFHKQVAQECVRVVPGVRRIRNLLRVLPQSY
jgi:osmotically-inducible protein OsmY